MEQMKYRIRVEVIEGAEIPEDEMPDQQLLNGIECDGFALLLHKGHASTAIALHDITACDVAMAMKGKPAVQTAAEIAKILERAENERIPDFLQSLAKKLKESN